MAGRRKQGGLPELRAVVDGGKQPRSEAQKRIARQKAIERRQGAKAAE